MTANMKLWAAGENQVFNAGGETLAVALPRRIILHNPKSSLM
jgi:hypothetical protein